MRHEAALKRLDEIDSKQGYGLALRWHLARCASCSLAEAQISAAMRAYREDAHPLGTDAIPEGLIEDHIKQDQPDEATGQYRIAHPKNGYIPCPL